MARRAAIIVGGGSSTRSGVDKLTADVGGRPLIAHTVEVLAGHVDLCVLACREDQMPGLARLGLPTKLVPGGSTRTESEMSGLAAVGDGFDLIAIHDGARPLVTGDLVEALFEAAGEFGGAIPVLEPKTPTIRREDLSVIEAAVVQTPQVFHAAKLLAAYVKAAQEEYSGHDTADVVLRYSDVAIQAVPGDPGNIKVTFPEDLDQVREYLEGPSRNERG